MRRELFLLLALFEGCFERDDLEDCCCLEVFLRSRLRLSEFRRDDRLSSLLLVDVVSNRDESSERLSDRELASLFVDCPDSRLNDPEDEPDDEDTDEDLSREEDIDDRAPFPRSDSSSSLWLFT